MRIPARASWGGGLLVACAVAVLVQPAAATVLCRKRSGSVVVAERCGRRQTLLGAQDLGLVGPTGAAGTPGADGERGVVPYRVVDAAGHQVGTVFAQIGDNTQVALAHDALAVPVQVKVANGTFADGVFAARVYYEASDCTGTPFIRGGGSLLPRGQLVGTVLYYSTQAPVMGSSFGSQEAVDASCSGGTMTTRGACCRAQASSTAAGAATGVPLSTLGITLPLTLEARP